MALRRRVPLVIVRAANQRELLRQYSKIEGMEWQRLGPLRRNPGDFVKYLIVTHDADSVQWASPKGTFGGGCMRTATSRSSDSL